MLYYEYLFKKSVSLREFGFELAYGNSNSWTEIPFVKISNRDITIKVKSKVEKENGELVCHYLWIDSYDNQDLEKFLKDNGFSKKNENENDTVYTRTEKDWDNNQIDNYRNTVAENVLSLVSDLSSFLNENSYGQQ